MRFGLSQRWFLGGALAAVGLLLIAWFALISPERGRTEAVRARTATTEARLPGLKRRLADLERQNADKAQYLAQLDKDRQALPSAAGLAEFLRELQAGGDGHGAAVTSVVVGSPKQVSAGGGRYYSVPVTLAAQGGLDALNTFLDQLQQVQPRAVLITNANLDTGADSHETPTLSLSVQMFVTSIDPAATPSAATRR
jgi:Tfp pilus assembly protein PilO